MDLANETFEQYATDDLRADESFKPYAAMKGIDLINSHKELTGQVKTATETQAQYEIRLSTAVEPLPENATPEQQKDYQAKVRTLMGVPEKPTDYKVQLPEGVSPNDPLLMAYAEKAHAAGMSPAQVQAGINSFTEYAAKAETEAVKSAETALKLAWGPQYEANAKTSQATLKAVAKEAGVPDTELAGLVPVLNRSAPFAQMIFKISRHYKEATLQGIGSSGAPGSDTGKSAVDRLAEKIAARTPT